MTAGLESGGHKVGSWSRMRVFRALRLIGVKPHGIEVFERHRKADEIA